MSPLSEKNWFEKTGPRIQPFILFQNSWYLTIRWQARRFYRLIVGIGAKSQANYQKRYWETESDPSNCFSIPQWSIDRTKKYIFYFIKFDTFVQWCMLNRARSDKMAHLQSTLIKENKKRRSKSTQWSRHRLHSIRNLQTVEEKMTLSSN